MVGYDKRTTEFWIKLRLENRSLNDWIELPALKRLMPVLKGKKVMDLGSGTGEFSLTLARKGALVTSVEPSKHMLSHSPKHKRIIYYNIESERINFKNKFDLVVAKMLFDNVKNLRLVLKKVHQSLKKKGLLIFTIPHPFRYSFGKKQWDQVTGWQLISYFNERVIKSNWEGNVVTHYHRTVQTIFNKLIKTGFRVVEVIEPTPQKGLLKVSKKLYDHYSKIPFAILFKCVKE